MSKKKLARMVGVCTIAIMIIVGITIFPSCQSTSTLVTHDCTDHTTNSLTAHATVNSLEAGPLSRRGFVFAEGTDGDTGLNITIIPLVNPSFEEGDPPDGWDISNPGSYNCSTEQVNVGSHSVEVTSDATSNTWVRQTFAQDEYNQQTVTVGAWVWCDSTEVTRIALVELSSWGGTYSAYHTGSGEWEFLTATRTIRSDSTSILVYAPHVIAGGNTAYCDGVVIILSSVFEDGEFDTAGSYSLVIEGLKPDTSYRVRAFVENAAGISYGNTVTCTTLS